MTIALGILSPDGVVIAADTEETWGYLGGAKVSGYKIISRIVEAEDRAFAASGAGSAGYLDALNQELADNFVDVVDPVALERRIREKLKKFYRDHMIPLKVPEHDRPNILLAASWKGQPATLWANADSTLFRCKQYFAVGAGKAHATMLLSRLLPNKFDSTTDLAAYIAAFVVYQVKDYVEGCGMGTHVTVLKDGNAQFISEEVNKKLEHQFERQLRNKDTQWLRSAEKSLALIRGGFVQIAGEAVVKRPPKLSPGSAS